LTELTNNIVKKQQKAVFLIKPELGWEGGYPETYKPLAHPYGAYIHLARKAREWMMLRCTNMVHAAGRRDPLRFL
jgi:hypothetical protein